MAGILDHRFDELVVVIAEVAVHRVMPGQISEGGLLPGALEVGQRLARGGVSVDTDGVKDLAELPVRLGRGVRGLQSVDPQGTHPAAESIAEQGHEGGRLQHQHPARRIVPAAAVALMQGFGGRVGVDRDDARLSEEQLAGGEDDRRPERLRVDALPNRRGGRPSRVRGAALSEGREQIRDRLRAGRPGPPVRREGLGELEILSPGPIGGQIALRGVGLVGVVLHGVGQGSQEGLGTRPTQGVQQPMAVGRRDGLVSDAAEIACGIAKQQVEQALLRNRSVESDDRPVRRLGIPALHGRDERVLGLARRRHPIHVDRVHSPAGLTGFFRLAGLEHVGRPKQGRPTILVAPLHDGALYGMHHHEGVILESHHRVRRDGAGRSLGDGAEQLLSIRARHGCVHQVLGQTLAIGVEQQRDQRIMRHTGTRSGAGGRLHGLGNASGRQGCRQGADQECPSIGRHGGSPRV
jgi:hypothetical protein